MYEVNALINSFPFSLSYSQTTRQIGPSKDPLFPNKLTSSTPRINFVKPKMVVMLIKQSKSKKSTRVDKNLFSNYCLLSACFASS